MSVHTNKEKTLFCIKWTLSNALVIILIYPIGLIIGLFLSGLMGYSMDEWGTPFEQTIMKIGFGMLIGFGIGITQWLFLRKVFDISRFWIYSAPIGFVIVEMIAGIILWQVDINRGELSFVEKDSLGHTVILAISGLVIGLIQLPVLRQYYSKVWYWVIASTVAWGISVLITAIGQESEVILLITFIIGAILYGAITGVTLLWILKPKELQS